MALFCQKRVVMREGGVRNGMNQTQTCITVCITHCTSSDMLVIPEVVISPQKSVL